MTVAAAWTAEQTATWLSRRAEAYDNHGLAWYGVRDEADRLVGTCGTLIGRATASEPEIGYVLAPAYRRRGFATEAAGAVVDEARRTGFATLWATIRPANTASRRIVERLGFIVDHESTDAKGALLWYVART